MERLTTLANLKAQASGKTVADLTRERDQLRSSMHTQVKEMKQLRSEADKLNRTIVKDRVSINKSTALAAANDTY